MLEGMLSGQPSDLAADHCVVEPDYFQFYARRSGAAWASDKVPPEGYQARLWSDGGFVYVGTRRKFGTTPVDVAVLPSRASDPDALWQHVVEVSLAPGGPLEIFDWPGDEPALTIELPPGDMRLRVSWQGLVEGRYEGMDENGNSDERLLFELWPAPVESLSIVKEWSGWPPGAPGFESLANGTLRTPS